MLIYVDKTNLTELTVLYPSPCLKSVWKKSNAVFPVGLRGLIPHLLQTQPAFTYLKLAMETLDQGVKYVQS